MLSKWLPQEEILAISRYDSRFFPDWDQQKLLPLSKDQIERYSYQLLAAISSDVSDLEYTFKQFQTHLQQNRVVSLASRNPLLLGFLVQLSLAGTQPPTDRASLYEQIIDLWYLALLRERGTTVPDLDSVILHVSIAQAFKIGYGKSATIRAGESLFSLQPG